MIVIDQPEAKLLSLELDSPRVGASARGAKKAKGTGANFVHDALRRSILTLEIEPGSILDELQLARQYGVSRSPVRAALVRLGATGLVEMLPNRSSIVSPIRFESIAPLLSAQEILFRLTTREAAKRRRDGDVKRLRALQDRLEGLRDEGRVLEMIGVNQEFHLLIAKIAGNSWYEAWLRSLMDEGQRVIRLYQRTLGDDVPLGELRRHRDIIRAIEEGDPDAAELAGRRDAEIIRAQLTTLLAEDEGARLALA
jgi:DNA-binding GntR family transcriptional regulator